MDSIFSRSSSEDWQATVKNATRACVVNLHNYTSAQLVLKTHDLLHGTWRLFPPDKIQPYSEIRFATTNYGLVGVTQGKVSYRIAQTSTEFFLDWLNPLVGNSTANTWADEGKQFKLSVKRTNDNLMLITWTIDELEVDKRESQIVILQEPDDDWKLLQAGLRSVTVIINNTTPDTLYRLSSDIPQGTWSRLPPSEIPAGGQVEFGCRAKNTTTFASGLCTYQSQGGNIVTLNFETPVIGQNKFGGKCEGIYRIDVAGNLISQALCTFTISIDETKKAEISIIQETPLDSSSKIMKHQTTVGRRLFGMPLEVIIKSDVKGDVPSIVANLCDYIEQEADQNDLLFRNPGLYSEVVELRKLLELGDRYDLDKYNLTSVAAILKSYLKELPSPLVPASMATYFTSYFSEKMQSEMPFATFYSSFMYDLPTPNRYTLRRLCKMLFFLNKAQILKADVAAIIWGPIISPEQRTAQDIETTPMVVECIEQVILDFPNIFGTES